jgi:hypothetical protein
MSFSHKIVGKILGDKQSKNKKDYKVFDTSTKQGIKDAEKHQQALYKKYDKVKVEPSGLDKTEVWGE